MNYFKKQYYIFKTILKGIVGMRKQKAYAQLDYKFLASMQQVIDDLMLELEAINLKQENPAEWYSIQQQYKSLFGTEYNDQSSSK